jgi:hypothetical protein
LTSAPYALSQESNVNVKVIATNIKGDSQESPQGNGATIITAPNAPINLAENTALRTPTTLGLTWNESPTNGGATVTEYRISRALSGGAYSEISSTSVPSYVDTGLTSG